MVRTRVKLLGYPIAAVAAATLAIAAIVVPAAPAQAQYWGYYPPPYYAYPYYAYPYAYYPPAWTYSPYDSPFGYTLNNPYYPCVWEGKGCPTGR